MKKCLFILSFSFLFLSAKIFSQCTVRTAGKSATCNGLCDGAALATPSGGTAPYTYTWSGGQITAAATGLCTNTYSVTVTDSKGCIATQTVTISQPAALKITTTIRNARCFGASNGSIITTVTGGAGVYTYAWSTTPKQTGKNATNLSVGIYTVTVTDRNGCSITASDTIKQPAAISLSTTSKPASCNSANGSADVTVGGGSAPYAYRWSTVPAQTGSALANVSSGTYIVTVTDGGGCTASTSVVVANSSGLAVSVSGTGVSCAGLANGSATASVTGGQTPYTYSWSTNPPQTTKSITGLSGGTYTVTVIDANSCSVKASVTISRPTALTATLARTNVTCFGGTNGTITSTTGGGTSPYSYAWSTAPVQNTNPAVNLSAGTYTVTIVDSHGCTITRTSTVSQPVNLTVNLTEKDVTCNGGANGTATAAGSGGTAPYTYLWSTLPAQTTATASALKAGTYTVTVSDRNNCKAINSITVSEPAPIALTTTSTNTSCAGSNGKADVTVSGGNTPYAYVWSNGATTALDTALAAGTYTVVVTDSKKCRATTTATVANTSGLTASVAGIINVNCNGTANGSASLSVNGGTSPYTYKWSTNPPQTSSTATNLSAGKYTATVTDSKTCAVVVNITLTQPTAIIPVFARTNVSCNGGSNGSASVTVTGGKAPYNYSWSTGSTSNMSANLSAGTYTLTVSDANACSVTRTVTITQPAPFNVTTTNTAVRCNGGSAGTASAIITGGTAPYTYVWSTVPVQKTRNATGLSAGVYTVTITDSKGCSTTAKDTITQPVVIVATATGINSTCSNSNGSASVSATGGSGTYNYSWSSGSTSATANSLSAGTYSVTVTDSKGCSKATTVTINNTNGGTVSIGSVVNVTCNGGANGSAVGSVTGGSSPFTYLWSSGSTGSTAGGLSARTYSLTVTDKNGCTSSSSVTITQPAGMTTNIVQNGVTCNGGSNGIVSVFVTGGTPGYTYNWSSGSTSVIASNLKAATYTLTVTDANSCSSVSTVTVTEPTQVSSTSAKTNVSCNGGSDGVATITATGGTPAYTYAWSTGATTANVSGLSAGIYTATVTDKNGCSIILKDTIAEPAAIVPVTSTSNSTCGSSNGSASVSATGGSGTYSYSWSTGSTAATVNSLSAGVYNVTVTDSKSCSKSASAVINNAGVGTVSIGSVVNVTCNSGSDGSAIGTVTGGSSPFTYSWSNGGTSLTTGSLTVGTYTLTVTDKNGCSSYSNVTITQPSALSLAISEVGVTCHGGSSGIASANVSGGSPGYTYSWSSGSASVIANNLSALTYTLTVADANGCSIASTVSITEPSAITATKASTGVSCNGGSDGAASVAAAGGTPSYTYVWSSGAILDTAKGLSTGIYTVTITDKNGCSITVKDTITEPKAINPVLTSANSTCGNSNGTAGVSPTGGTGVYTYSWSNGATASTITTLSAGVYTVTITDNNNCNKTASATISDINGETVSIGSSSDVGCNGTASGSATGAVSGGTSPFSYSWSNGASTATANNLSAGVYSLTVTDKNGCASSANVTITEPTALLLSTNESNEICNGGSTGSSTALVSGGTPSYTYSWNSGSASAVASNLSAGIYTVTVTDQNGCTATTASTVTEPTAITTSFVQTDITCNGSADGSLSAVVAGGTPGYAYLWSTTSTADTLTGLNAGTYSVTITDANNCFLIKTVSITEPAVLNVSVTNTLPMCNGGNDGVATAAAAGGTSPYNYTWSTNPIQTSSVASGLSAGIFNVTVTDSRGCITMAADTMKQPVVIIAQVTTNDASCGNSTGTATVSGTGGTGTYTYLWGNGTTSPTLSNLSAGIYNVTLTDSKGCFVTTSAIINNAGGGIAKASLINNVTCNGASNGSASGSISGGTAPYTYSWSNGSASATATNMPAGTYTLTVTDKNGCSAYSNVTITQPLAILVSATHSDALCNGENNGEAQVTVSGGAGGIYTYAWSTSPVQTTATANNLTAGAYTLTVTDAGNCSATTVVAISQPDLITASFIQRDVTCNGGSDGAAAVVANGGNPGYKYSWSNGTLNNSPSNLSASVYTVTISDVNGCSGVFKDTIHEPKAMVLTAATTDATCGVSDGSATITANGGVNPYMYSWSTLPSQSGKTATGLSAGLYTVEVTDSLGCYSQLEVPLGNSGAGRVNVSVTDPACFGMTDGSASATITGGFAPFTYSWNTNPPVADSVITNVPAGKYIVSVTEKNGCIIFGTAVVTEPAAIVLTKSATAASCITCTDGSATVSANGGTPPFTYSWSTSPVQNTATAVNLTPGTYSICVTDSKGCSVCDTIQVNAVTGINTILASTMLNIQAYPNPTSGELNIVIQSPVTQDMNVRVINLMGQVLFAEQVKQVTSYNKVLNLEGQASGMYLLQLITVDKVYNQRIVLR